VASSRAYLVVSDPVAGRCIVTLQPGRRLSIGRAPTNALVLHDERASRFHAEVFPSPAGWMIRDLDSRNGTFVDGDPVQGDRLLEPGSVVSIGRVEMLHGRGEPPGEGGPEQDTGTMPPLQAGEAEEWRASVRQRRSQSHLLERSADPARSPGSGAAAAELCRLAFSLAVAADTADVARQGLSTAMEATRALRGVVLLSEQRKAQATSARLTAAAALPEPWPERDLPRGIVAGVLAENEAVLTSAANATMIAAPVRIAGRPVGVVCLEVRDGATAEDLDFLLAACEAIGLAVENLTTREHLSLRLASTTDEVDRLRRRLGQESQMVVGSRAMEGVLGQMGQVARTKATILVRGESGVGKELVARGIHDASDRSAGPFVCLNCAALSETLLESELFGHEKGAFTGATERKIGKFEAADRGTLFLDEIGEMTAAIQAKFLRVLEGHPFERVGGHARVSVDVRVVAATNRDLEEAVVEGSFRRDLYFRLKVVEILVPPLRKRPGDVERLARHFLDRFVEETGRAVEDFTPEALEVLCHYHWPGNVRELRNVVERAVVLSLGERIGVEDLALSPLGVSGDTGRGKAVATNGPAGDGYVEATLEEIEKRHVLATLEAAGGNKTKAAAILGIERSTLDRKLGRWGCK
jgi:transcriptional regulator with GAF, ATPase, and Fis domain